MSRYMPALAKAGDARKLLLVPEVVEQMETGTAPEEVQSRLGVKSLISPALCAGFSLCRHPSAAGEGDPPSGLLQ